MTKELAKKILPKGVITLAQSIKHGLFDGYSKKSYSQEGEDLILMRFFEKKANGFYVDVGAHHPKRFSNTYLFYKKGWRGINIDARPGSMKQFKKERVRDINLEIPISVESKTLTYYMFNEPALNGFSKDLSEAHAGKNGYEIDSTIELKTERLDKVLDENLPKDTAIDFLSIDVEGLDFEVLRSLDLSRYRPVLILIEVLGSSLSELLDSEISRYLAGYGYEVYGKAVNTVFYKR